MIYILHRDLHLSAFFFLTSDLEEVINCIKGIQVDLTFNSDVFVKDTVNYELFSAWKGYGKFLMYYRHILEDEVCRRNNREIFYGFDTMFLENEDYPYWFKDPKTRSLMIESHQSQIQGTAYDWYRTKFEPVEENLPIFWPGTKKGEGKYQAL